MMRISTAIAALCLLTACGSEGESTTAAGDRTDQGSETVTEQVKGLDGEYLNGTWCYRSYEVGGETTDENLTYVFSADGTLKYQNNSSTPVEKPGSWEFTNGQLKVLPTLRFFDMQVAEVNADQMTFAVMGGEMLWTRGAC